MWAQPKHLRKSIVYLLQWPVVGFAAGNTPCGIVTVVTGGAVVYGLEACVECHLITASAGDIVTTANILAAGPSDPCVSDGEKLTFVVAGALAVAAVAKVDAFFKRLGYCTINYVCCLKRL